MTTDSGMVFGAGAWNLVSLMPVTKTIPSLVSTS